MLGTRAEWQENKQIVRCLKFGVIAKVLASEIYYSAVKMEKE